nr:hypothetical protein [Enorma phocaeensis]
MLLEQPFAVANDARRASSQDGTIWKSPLHNRIGANDYTVSQASPWQQHSPSAYEAIPSNIYTSKNQAMLPVLSI